MKNNYLKIVIVFVLLATMSTLTGCFASDIPNEAKDYIKKKYGFDVVIINKPNLNEGNMGETSFEVRQKNDEKVNFNIFISGLFSSKIVGDDYILQKRLFDMKEEFVKQNKEIVNQAGIDELKFELRGDLENYQNLDKSTEIDNATVRVSSSKITSCFDGENMTALYSFQTALKTYFEKFNGLKIKEIAIQYKNSESNLYFEIWNLSSESTQSDFIRESEIGYEGHLTKFGAYSVYHKEKTYFDALEKDIQNLGFTYMHSGQDPVLSGDLDITIKDAQPIVYGVNLRGDIENFDKVYPLIQYLHSKKDVIYNPSIVSKDGKDSDAFEFDIRDDVSEKAVKARIKEYRDRLEEFGK